MKMYLGIFDYTSENVLVTEDDGKTFRRLDPRYDLRNHSPDGFSWGYTGSGPAQTALAILADADGEATAMRWYFEFKNSVIARLPQGDPWKLTREEVMTFVERMKRRDRDVR